MIITKQPSIYRVVCGPAPVRRWLDVLYAPAGWQILRGDVRPRLAIVPGNVKRTVVGAGPNHSFFERRLSNRIESAVELFTGYVASYWFAADSLAAFGFCRQIRRNLFPADAFVARAVHVLRSVIKYIRIMRRCCHRRDALHSINKIACGIAVQ